MRLDCDAVRYFCTMRDAAQRESYDADTHNDKCLRCAMDAMMSTIYRDVLKAECCVLHLRLEV